MTPAAVVFDVGNVLFPWKPRLLYERLIDDDRALDAFLRDVVTEDWHFQHDLGRPFAETSAELIARFPEHRALIEIWGPRFADSIGAAFPVMAEIVVALDSASVPMFAITNFSGEFWIPFREREAAIFDRFRDIIVSGDERLVKPDPAIYALAIERFGMAPETLLFVDDRAENVAGAVAAGMHGHHFLGAEAFRTHLLTVGLL